jgi:hypothetical protein
MSWSIIDALNVLDEIHETSLIQHPFPSRFTKVFLIFPNGSSTSKGEIYGKVWVHPRSREVGHNTEALK